MTEPWPHEEPSLDFADRVMARVEREQIPPPPRRARSLEKRNARAAGVIACVLAAAAAFLVVQRSRAPVSHGDVRADIRREVSLGARGVAVAEPGAHLAWRGDEVTQDAGDVFYRVERGGHFVVHTPAGDVDVLGTCFRVRVGTSGSAATSETTTKEPDMQLHDVKAGLIGAASAMLATVVVYEGRVAVSRAGEPTANGALEVSAGAAARLDARGAHALGSAASADAAGGAGEPATTGQDVSLLAANANLADAIREYNRRLDVVTDEKTSLQKKLATAQEQLTAAGNDAGTPLKDPYDLSPDDWKRLAARGAVRVKMPCLDKNPWTPSTDDLTKMGLAPTDGPAVHDAYVKANERIWANVRPLCVAALGGDAQVADRLGVNICMHVVRLAVPAEDAAKQVAEMRAGIRPLPGAGETLPAPTQMLLDLTREQQAFEADLTSSFGPDEAHRILYSDSGACLSAMSEGPSEEVMKR